MKEKHIIIAMTALAFALSGNVALAQYNYGTPAAAPAVSAPSSSAAPAIIPTSAPSGSTASDPGSVVPNIPNTGAGGEAPRNIALLSASLFVALTGLVFLRKQKTA